MSPFRSILPPASAALAILALTVPAAAQRAGDRQWLVSVSWLAQHLSDSNLVLLHVGTETEYQAAHIPGARFASLHDLSKQDTAANALAMEMPSADTLRAHLAALGVGDRSRVIVYFGKDWVSPSTRLLFTLDYAGLGANGSLLDGGMPAWTREGHPVTDAMTPARTARLSPLQTRATIVDGAWVHAHIGAARTVIVDGRAAVFYDGVQKGGQRGGPQAAGHIPSAKSIPFTEVTNDQLFLRPLPELVQLFARAGVQPADTVVAYCHVGQQATAVVLAARLLGHPVLLYDGSFQDWMNHTEYPIDNPAKKN